MRIACVQFSPIFANVNQNIRAIGEHIKSSDAELIVFPEAAVSGYCFSKIEEVKEVAIQQNSLEFEQLRLICNQEKKAAIVGYVESFDNRFFNSAIFIGPDAIVGNYRKVHLPHLGLDRFVEQGNELELFEYGGWKIGIQICFDIRFPESARTLALKGAHLIAVPTNWPETAECSSDIICPARAAENQIFIAAANRVGTERGFSFIGKSKIIGPGGKILASAEHADVATIEANLDLSEAETKRIVKVKDEYELSLWEERKPELYQLN